MINLRLRVRSENNRPGSDLGRLQTLMICNCSVPSQLRAKIHQELPAAMGFLPAGPCFRTVSAVNAQTY
jgi:hypothetical protein